MDIEIKKSLFDYSPGELTLEHYGLSLRFAGRELSLLTDRLRTAVIVPSKDGGCRVDLDSDTGQVELFIPSKEDADKLVAALYALAGATRPVTMILDGQET